MTRYIIAISSLSKFWYSEIQHSKVIRISLSFSQGMSRSRSEDVSRWNNMPSNALLYMYRVLTRPFLGVCRTPGPKLMTDTHHSTLHVFDWGLLSIECESFHTLRFPIQIHGADAGVLSVEYWEIVTSLGPGPKIYDGYSELYTQDSHSIQIHWVLSVECWVSVISLGPGGALSIINNR